MEYLPEKKRTHKAQVAKKEAKIADFRQYLADKEVVLAIVKCKYQALYKLARLGRDAFIEPVARGPPDSPEGLLRQ